MGRSGLAMLLGADVGTTLVAFVLSFDLSLLGPLFILIGVFIKSKVYDKKTIQFGRGNGWCWLNAFIINTDSQYFSSCA